MGEAQTLVLSRVLGPASWPLVTKTPEGFYEVNTRPHGSQMKLIELVDPPGRVLDVGCSTGYLAGGPTKETVVTGPSRRPQTRPLDAGA